MDAENCPVSTALHVFHILCHNFKTTIIGKDDNYKFWQRAVQPRWHCWLFCSIHLVTCAGKSNQVDQNREGGCKASLQTPEKTLETYLIRQYEKIKKRTGHEH